MADPRLIPLARVREHCLSLPGVTEKLSHGAPAWFARKAFAYHHDHHHGDPHVALWCAAPEGMQQGLVDGAPEHYFRPPYVGHRGWVGVRLDTGLEWDAVAGAIEEGYAEVTGR